MCDCEGHDRLFARWTGYWPGELEALALGMDLNTLYLDGAFRLFFIKPTVSDPAPRERKNQ